MSEKNSIQEKRKDFLEATKDFKGKSSPTLTATEKVRRVINALDNLSISQLLALLHDYAGRSSPRPQKQIKQIKIRPNEFSEFMPQVSSSFTSQRKLLRLKNSPNKRHGMERIHTKGKTGKRKNK